MVGRYHKLTRYQMLRQIHFLRDVLPILTKLSKITQKDSLTIIELKKAVTKTLGSLKKLRNENGAVEDDWLRQVGKTDQGELCQPGKDGHFLRPLRSKRKLLGDRQLEKEIEAFGESKYNYLTAIIDNITMRFLNLSNELHDFLVLHSANQKRAGEKLMSSTK